MNAETFRLDATERATSLADGAASALHDAGHQASVMADRASRSLRDGAHELQARARSASHSTTAYIADEPVKSLLMAAAAGAVVMGLLSLMARSRR